LAKQCVGFSALQLGELMEAAKQSQYSGSKVDNSLNLVFKALNDGVG